MDPRLHGVISPLVHLISRKQMTILLLSSKMIFSRFFIFTCPEHTISLAVSIVATGIVFVYAVVGTNKIHM
jgi:hypothetical protein